MADCPTCGQIRTTAPKIRLLVCNNAPGRSTYEFVCPVCAQLVVKPASDQVISMLMTVGIRAELWNLPAELLEAHAGQPIGYDDILDFALDLDTADVWAELS